MGRYSIKELENLSGIKAHTIRIWEKRYNLLPSSRTDTNIRFYDDADLKYFLNVTLLVKKGLKISKAAKLSKEEVARKIAEVNERTNDNDLEINRLVQSMIDFDETGFQAGITSAILNLGLENAVTKVVYPFLEKTGILWQTGAIHPAQEHFVSNLIRQKLIMAVDGLMIPDKETAKRFLLFLPEGELHEIGLLFTNFLIRNRGIHTLYLGQSVPFSDLKSVASYYKPDALFFMVTSHPVAENLESYIQQLLAHFLSTKIYVSGAALKTLPKPVCSPNFMVLNSVAETLKIFDNLSKR